MTITDTPVDNGINLPALLDAREALTDAPEARPVPVAGELPRGERHAQLLDGREVQRPRRRADAPQEFGFDVDHPECFASEDHGADAGRDRPGRPRRLPHRRRRLGRPDPRHPAAIGHRHPRGRHGPARRARHRSRRAQRLQRGRACASTSTPTRRRTTSRPSWRSRRSARRSTTSSPTRPTSSSTSTKLSAGGHRPPVVIGAGHAGLAMSRHLTERSIDHVVLERGEVANSWRTERWPSLRLLTPNWQTRLPGYAYDGDDPDGFMTAAEVCDFIGKYATASTPRCRPTRRSRCVRRHDGGYEVVTDQGTWRRRPSCSPTAPATSRRSAARGGGAVVDRVAHADDLPRPRRAARRRRAGRRRVVHRCAARRRDRPLAAGPSRSPSASTCACPARYKDRDIFWWMDAARRARRALRRDRRHHPGPPRAVAATGRNAGARGLSTSTCCVPRRAHRGTARRITGGVAQFAGSLPNIVALADLKMNRLLNRFDEWAGEERG